MRRHVVITGTGRAGTSFLIQLLTNIGLDTGFDQDSAMSTLKSGGRAGLELDIRNEKCPYIVKSPWFCDYAQQVLQNREIEIEHVFIPIRDLVAAAESRRHVTRTGSSDGGIWYTNSLQPGDQELVLLKQIYKLIFALSDSHVPVTLIRYPKLTQDPFYLFEKLKPALKDMSFDDFSTIFHETVHPELVHQFSTMDC